MPSKEKIAYLRSRDKHYMNQYQTENSVRIQASEEAREILKKCIPPEPTLGSIAKMFVIALTKKIGYFWRKKPRRR